MSLPAHAGHPGFHSPPAEGCPLGRGGFIENYIALSGLYNIFLYTQGDALG